ncbi:MAG TPA: FmdB family zinc ribbon protein [Thermoleophilaceae bacterium]|nr:FmdB family zinc ribbon protein [Thermoleophilaceae bacterium]
MPTYEYRCERGHTFEVLQRMSDDPVTVCTECDARVQRVLHPVAVHFKGSGFYTTDYKKKGATASGDSGKNGSEGGASSSKGEKKAESSKSSGESSKSGSSAGAGSSD